jgi:hypothetical protein
MSVAMFPVPFPIQDWVEFAAFDPLRRQAAGVLGSGRDFVIDRGIPYWKISGGKTRKLFLPEILQLQAFASQLRGSSRFFTCYDPATAFPQLYMPAGPPAMIRAAPMGGAFNGFCSLAAIANSGLPNSIGNDVITIGAPFALPVGLTLMAGDKIELRQGVNLLSAGQAAFTSGWTAAGCTLGPDSISDPVGGETAARLVATAAGAFDIEGDFPQGNPATFYRISFWAVQVEGAIPSLEVVYSDEDENFTTIDTVVPSNAWTRYEFVAFMPAGAAAADQLIFKVAGAAAGATLGLWNPTVTEIDLETVSLHRVLDMTPDVANAGGSLTAWVEPEVPSSFVAGFGGATANVFKPVGKFRMLDFALPLNGQGRARPGECTFTAVSTLN